MNFLTQSVFSIIHFNIVIGYMCISIALCIYYSLQLYAWESAPMKFFELSFITIILSTFGQDFLRFLWLAVFIERTFATVYSKIYDQKRFLSVSIILVIMSYGIPTVIAYIRFYKSDGMFIKDFPAFCLKLFNFCIQR